MKKVPLIISEETRELLREVGKKNETYDEVIRRLIKFYIDKVDDSESHN